MSYGPSLGDGRLKPLEQPTPIHARDLAAPLPRRPGRPSRLDDARLGTFFEAIRRGMRPTPSARLVGISTNTLAGWIKRGRDRDAARPASPEYVNFVRLIDYYEALGEYEVIKNLVADLKGHPGAALRWLAMRWPERYGRSARATSDDVPEERRWERAAEPRAAVEAPQVGPTITIPLALVLDLDVKFYEEGVEVPREIAERWYGSDEAPESQDER